MLRTNRGGNRLCDIVQNTLGADVVEDLHDRGFILSGFAKTEFQVQRLRRFGDSEILPLVQNDETVAPGRLGLNGLFAVYRRLPDVGPTGVEHLEVKNQAQA